MFQTMINFFGKLVRNSKYDPIKLYYFSKFTLVDIYLSFTHLMPFKICHFISKFIGHIVEDFFMYKKTIFQKEETKKKPIFFSFF